MDILKCNIRKANKEHLCNYCDEKIKKGDTYRTSTIKNEYLYTWKSHLDCSSVASELMNSGYVEYPDGMTGQDFIEVVDEFYLEFFDESEKYNFRKQVEEIDKKFKTHKLKRNSYNWELAERRNNG